MTVAEFTQGLQTYPGMGDGFLAAQVAADTKRVEPLKSATDAETFALSGPGSRIGMNYLLGRERDATWRKNDRDWYPQLAELHAIITPIYQNKGLPIPDFADLQNQLCERHKHVDVCSGVREQLKREYRPASEPKPRSKKRKTKPVEGSAPITATVDSPPVSETPIAANPVTANPVTANPVDPNAAVLAAILADIEQRDASQSATAASPGPVDTGPPHCLPAALAYAARGWAVFPAPRGTKKSHKSAQHSKGRRWGATADADEIRRDYTRWPLANVGIPTGVENGIWVLEADTKEGHAVDGIAALQALICQHGALSETLQARSPSGSQHFYFTWPVGKAIANSASKIAPGVDVRGDGGMVLAPPSIKPGTGVYAWSNETAIAEAPGWLIDLAVAASFGANGDAREPNADLEAPLPYVKAAVAAIPNDDLDWESWNKVGMAIFAATGGSNEGFALFDTFSKKSKAKYTTRKTFDKWRLLHTSPPSEIGFGSLAYWATEANPDWQDHTEAPQDAAAASDNAKAETSSGASDGAKAETRPVRRPPAPNSANGTLAICSAARRRNRGNG